MSKLRIYGIARTRAFRALWMAEELGLDYDHVPIEIGPAGARKVVEAPFTVLEGALAGRPYLLGEEFTVADLNVAAVISRAVDMDLSATPRLARWLERCLERPAARTALALRAKADAEVPLEVTRTIARNNRL